MEGHFNGGTFHWRDISLEGHFTGGTFHWRDISLLNDKTVPGNF